MCGWPEIGILLLRRFKPLDSRAIRGMYKIVFETSEVNLFPSSTAPRTFSRTETIAGRQLTFEASSELELETRIREAYEVVEALGTQPREEPFVPELPAHERAELSEFQKVDLQLKFQRGELTAQQYLEQSGAIAEYLEAQGTPLELLRETVQTDAQNRFTQSWAEAAEAFRNIHSDWPGGQQNLEVLD